jgi:SAM-dependent methyltransferase
MALVNLDAGAIQTCGNSGCRACRSAACNPDIHFYTSKLAEDSILGSVVRENRTELLDRRDIPIDLARKSFRDIAVIHRLLGNTRLVRLAIARDSLPVRRVMDIGCGTGLVLHDLHRKLGIEVIGVDVNPRPTIASPVPIYRADATCDVLPRADVAFCMYVGHHLCETELVQLIRNVGRSCRRFIMLDLVRHRLPLAFFRYFLAHFVSPITVVDGQRSILRSYTPYELEMITSRALEGIPATFHHSVAPFHARQVIDIRYHGLTHDDVTAGDHRQK